MGYNARDGTAFGRAKCYLATAHACTFRRALWCFAVLSFLNHPRVFTLSSYRYTYRFVPDGLIVNVAQEGVGVGQLGSRGARRQTKTQSQIGVKRFSGRRRNLLGGLHDSAAAVLNN